MKVLYIALAALMITISTQAQAAKHQKRVVAIVFDETDAKANTVDKLTPEQIAAGGQLAANAHMETRLQNDLNAPIPVDEDLFEVKADSQEPKTISN